MQSSCSLDKAANASKPHHSSNESTFNGEIAIHFRGLEGLNKPLVWVFSQITVCLRCGFAQFVVPERELKVLRDGVPVEGAAVWLGSSEEE
jgi:hypothetical protein